MERGSPPFGLQRQTLPHCWELKLIHKISILSGWIREVRKEQNTNSAKGLEENEQRRHVEEDGEKVPTHFTQ